MEETILIYGPGGFDPSKPDSNVVSSATVTVPEPTPDAASSVAQALANLDPATASVADVISAVRQALAEAGAQA